MALCFSLRIPTYAASVETECEWLSVDIDAEIARALNGEADIEFDASDLAEAVIERADGTVENATVYVTTRALPVPMSVNDDIAGTVYATTPVVTTASSDKSDTNSKNDYYVTAYATIYWKDNLGPSNEFLGASGGWDCDINPNTGNVPTLSDRKVKMNGQSNARDPVYQYFYPTSDTFNIDQASFNYTRLKFWLISTVTVDGTDTLTLRVDTGLFT